MDIENELFLVQGSNVAILDRRTHDVVGVTPTTDSEGNIVSSGLNSERIVMLPIPRIAEIITNGFSIKVVNEEDIIKIYDICIKFVATQKRVNAGGYYKQYSDEFINTIDMLREEIQTKHPGFIKANEPTASFIERPNGLIDFNKPKKPVQQLEQTLSHKSSVGLYK